MCWKDSKHPRRNSVNANQKFAAITIPSPRQSPFDAGTSPAMRAGGPGGRGGSLQAGLELPFGFVPIGDRITRGIAAARVDFISTTRDFFLCESARGASRLGRPAGTFEFGTLGSWCRCGNWCCGNRWFHEFFGRRHDLSPCKKEGWTKWVRQNLKRSLFRAPLPRCSYSFLSTACEFDKTNGRPSQGKGRKYRDSEWIPWRFLRYHMRAGG